jgi:hypothetical protein
MKLFVSGGTDLEPPVLGHACTRKAGSLVLLALSWHRGPVVSGCQRYVYVIVVLGVPPDAVSWQHSRTVRSAKFSRLWEKLGYPIETNNMLTKLPSHIQTNISWKLAGLEHRSYGIDQFTQSCQEYSC